MTIWVCKLDGTIQCDAESKETTLEEMYKDLAKHIGKENILNMEKRSRTMITLCGMPTGTVNAYELTEDGYYLLQHGFVGSMGFVKCSDNSETENEVNVGQMIGELTRSNPTTIKELIGRQLRVYVTGDMISGDWQPDRANIEVGQNRKIVDIWFG